MPDFFTVPAPMASPTSCVFCAASSDPAGFVDGGRDIVPHGRLYVCSTCGVQIGARFGMLAAADAQELEDTAHDLGVQVERLQKQVESSSDQILVSKRHLETIVKEAVSA